MPAVSQFWRMRTTYIFLVILGMVDGRGFLTLYPSVSRFWLVISLDILIAWLVDAGIYPIHIQLNPNSGNPFLSPKILVTNRIFSIVSPMLTSIFLSSFFFFLLFFSSWSADRAKGWRFAGPTMAAWAVEVG